MANEPRRRWTIELQADGDTREEAVSMLAYFLKKLREGSPACITGGYSRGGAYKLTEHHDVTPERFQADLEKWLEQQRGPEAKPTAVEPCPVCKRSWKGQGGAYFGPACAAGDACCTTGAVVVAQQPTF